MCCFLLCCRFRQLQLSADSRQSDLQKEINVKQFELEKMQMILDETTSNLRQAKLEAEKYQSKSEVWLSSQYDCQLELVMNLLYKWHYGQPACWSLLVIYPL